MPKTNLWITIVGCCLGALSLCAQSSVEDQLDALQRGLDSRERIQLLIQLADAYQYIHIDSSLEFGQQAIALGRQLRDEVLLANTYLTQAYLLERQLQKDTSRWMYERARDVFCNASGLDHKAACLEAQLGIALMDEREDRVVELGFQQLDVARRTDDSLRMAEAYRNIATGFYYQEQYEEATDYDRRALPLFRRYAPTFRYVGILSSAGNALRQDYESEAAEAIFMEGLDLIKNKHCPVLKGELIFHRAINIMDTDTNDPRIGDLYQTALNYARQGDDVITQALIYGNLGYWALDRKNYRAAVQYLKQELAVAEPLGDPYFTMDFYYALAESYEGLRQHDSAYFYMKRYAEQYEASIKTEYHEQIAQLHTRYETNEKEAALQLQNAQLQRQRRTLWIGAIFLGLITLGGTLLLKLTYQLRQRNREKEFLIKEVHHRVKNNLQTLSSLLHLQSRYITNDSALSAVQAGQNRVEAMGLIHQKLYMGDRLAAVDMSEYLRQLSNNLLETYGVTDDRITIQLDVEPLRVDVDSAIPLSLIINELLANALKYAFPDGRRGHITVRLWRDSAEQVCLKILDNGVGVKHVDALPQGTGFGTRLIKILNKKLKGTSQLLDLSEGYGTFLCFKQVKLV